MGQYSIKELESLSGVKAHTLRIWEKRFNLLNPERTETNIRYYSDEDLRKLLNVSLLTSYGKKISEVASFTKEQLEAAILEIDNSNSSSLKKVNALILPMVELNELEFNKLFDQYIEELGVEETLVNIIHPFLERVGVLWLSGEIQPAQEHIVSNIIRQKLLHAIENLPFPQNAAKNAVLFLPEGEYHELGLLFFHYLLRKRGIRNYYIGQSTPIGQIIKLHEQVEPDYMITYSIVKTKEQIEKYLNKLIENGVKNIYFVENNHQSSMNINYPTEINVIHSYKDIAELK